MNIDSFLGNIGWLVAAIQLPFTAYVIFWVVLPKFRKK